MELALIDQLITAAGGPMRDLVAFTTTTGLDRLAPLLVDEVAFRCGPATSPMPVTVGFRITSGTDSAQFHLLFRRGERVKVQAPDSAEAAVLAECDLVDLAAALYGPDHGGSDSVLRTRVPAVEAPEPGSMPDWPFVHSASVALDVLLSASSGRKPDIGGLALANGSDKWGALHRFAPLYDRHFSGLRNDAVRVLEIGIGGYGFHVGGGSLSMWKHYFHRGVVFGLDIYDKSELDQPRITTVVADQSSPDQLRAIAEQHGPFDVIIDDGSHVNQHVRVSLRTLFPYLRTGGYYVIEDLWTSYCPGFGGDDTVPASGGTSLGLLKNLVDSLHHEDWPEGSGATRDEIDSQLVGLHLYRNIAFLHKGVNAEGRLPGWIPRSIDLLMP